MSLIADLLHVLSEEELLRVAHRLRRNGKNMSALAVDLEIALREAEVKKAEDGMIQEKPPLEC